MNLPEHPQREQENEESPPVIKLLEALQAGTKLESMLTETGATEFQVGLVAACASHPTETGKLLVQLYFDDPAEVKIEQDETCWLGLEYDFFEADGEISLALADIFVPTTQRDPIDNPEFADYAHIVIEKGAVAWKSFE